MALWQHGEKESKEIQQKENCAETRHESDRGADHKENS
jgi:hypothetical protein